MPRVSAKELFSPGFFINLAISLVVTSWVPFVHFIFKDEEGNVAAESYRPVYKLYIDVAQDPSNGMLWAYIGLHFVIVFLISLAVWYGVLRYRARAASAASGA